MPGAARGRPSAQQMYPPPIALWFASMFVETAAGCAAARHASARVSAACAVGQAKASDGFLHDWNGFGNDAELRDGATLLKGLIDTSQGNLALPAGKDLWGPVAPRGAAALWARPLFEPTEPGDALSDGFGEIAIYLDHGTLVAKVNGPAAVSVVAALPAGQFPALAAGRILP